MEHTVEIVSDQLVADEEFRDSFLRNPRRTLGLADEWGLPLSTTEIHALVATCRPCGTASPTKSTRGSRWPPERSNRGLGALRRGARTDGRSWY
jgi:hypothetical protein